MGVAVDAWKATTRDTIIIFKMLFILIPCRPWRWTWAWDMKLRSKFNYSFFSRLLCAVMYYTQLHSHEGLRDINSRAVIMPRCTCSAKAYGSLLVFLSFCHSVILSVCYRDSGSTRAIQVLKLHKWVQSHVFSDLNWLDFWDKAWFSMYS